MKLQTRLSLVISLIILLTSTSIGYFALSISYKSQLQFFDTTLGQVVDELSNSSDDPLSLATYLADQSNQKFSVEYAAQDLDLISLYESNSQLSIKPSEKDLISALIKPISLGGVRLRTFQVSQGEYLLMYFSLSDLADNRNNNIRLLFIFTIIVIFIAISLTTLLFRKDNQLNVLVNSLKQNQARMQEFMGDASHELRTPLTVIKGYFELLTNKEGNEEKKQSYRNRINAEIIRMQEIIDDLLFILEIDESTQTNNQAAPISDLIQQQIFDLRNFQPSRLVDAQIQPNLMVGMSAFHLEQLLANIFSNLKRHTPENSQVEISLGKKGNNIDLIIEDSGSGLPSNFYQGGIQAFRRFDKSRSRQNGGSGLGMSIMDKLIKKSNGEIKLSPSKFEGLKIQISLPAH
jgi:signal transduction histidine kinase